MARADRTGRDLGPHFETRSWDQIQDQFDAGFPIYVQPANTTPALVVWEFDYVNPLPSLMVTADLDLHGGRTDCRH